MCSAPWANPRALPTNSLLLLLLQLLLLQVLIQIVTSASAGVGVSGDYFKSLEEELKALTDRLSAAAVRGDFQYSRYVVRLGYI